MNTLKHDPDATGPRDAAEYEAMRAAHRTMRHYQLLRTADALRIEAMTARTRNLITTTAADEATAAAYNRAAALRGKEAAAPALLQTLATAAEKAHAAHVAAVAQMAEHLPTIRPCTAPRCTGHAVMDPRQIRARARAGRPIPPEAIARRNKAARAKAAG